MRLKGYRTIQQCADDLGKTVRTMQRWHRLGTGPRRTIIGRTPVVSEADWNAWLEGQREELPQRRA